MADLRLIAVLALAGCRADAQPAPLPSAGAHSGITPPAGWIALPVIADAVAAAARAPGVTVAGSEAWGEPAIGCYAAWLALTGRDASTPDQVATAVIAGFGSSGSDSVALHDARPPAAGSNAIELAFARGAYHGKLRVALAVQPMTVLACFANDREPGACDAPCAALLGGAHS